MFCDQETLKLAAHRFLKKAMKRSGQTRIVVTDKLRSYGAAMRDASIIEWRGLIAV
nr:hypothetical protein [Algimonas arctica]